MVLHVLNFSYRRRSYRTFKDGRRAEDDPLLRHVRRGEFIRSVPTGAAQRRAEGSQIAELHDIAFLQILQQRFFQAERIRLRCTNCCTVQVKTICGIWKSCLNRLMLWMNWSIFMKKSMSSGGSYNLHSALCGLHYVVFFWYTFVAKVYCHEARITY